MLLRTEWHTASRTKLIKELERLHREIERQRREHERADQDRNRYRQERDALRKKIERLEDELDDARRALYRQAAPFSRGAPRRPPRRPGRKPGAAYGRRAHRPTTVYAIQPGRGFEEAATVLGADFAGILVRDGWKPYRRFADASHQTCLAHLLRRCRMLMRDHHEYHFAPQVQRVLQHALRLQDHYLADRISMHGLAVARGHLEHQLQALITRPGRHRLARNFAAHLPVERPAVLTFLFAPDLIDATNWRAEHALRPAMVTRKVCGGNRSGRGAHTQEVLASVLRTIHQRQLDAAPIFLNLLCSPDPLTALAPPPTIQ